MREEDYWQSIEDFCDLCEEVLADNFVSFIVIGSIGAGDCVPGWSDVDSYLVLKERKPDDERNVKSMIETITQKYPYYRVDRGSWFTVMVETKEFFLEPYAEPLTLWDVKNYSKIARGEDLRDDIDLPPLDPAWADKNTEWMLDFLRKEKNASPFWKIRNSIGFILCGARNVLLKNGLYHKKYSDIISEFRKHYPATGSIVALAGSYRSNWLEQQYKEINAESFYESAIKFLEWCGNVEG